MPSFRLAAQVAALIALLGLAPNAFADAGAADTTDAATTTAPADAPRTPAHDPTATPPPQSAATMANDPAGPARERNPAQDDWQYTTEHFFALTRGLDEEKLSTTARRCIYVVTVPLDVGMIPTAAIAGLYGS